MAEQQMAEQMAATARSPDSAAGASGGSFSSWCAHKKQKQIKAREARDKAREAFGSWCAADEPELEAEEPSEADVADVLGLSQDEWSSAKGSDFGPALSRNEAVRSDVRSDSLAVRRMQTLQNGRGLPGARTCHHGAGAGNATAVAGTAICTGIGTTPEPTGRAGG